MDTDDYLVMTNLFPRRSIPDACEQNAGTLTIDKDDEGRVMLGIATEWGDGAGMYLSRESAKEIIRILLSAL